MQRSYKRVKRTLTIQVPAEVQIAVLKAASAEGITINEWCMNQIVDGLDLDAEERQALADFTADRRKFKEQRCYDS